MSSLPPSMRRRVVVSLQTEVCLRHAHPHKGKLTPTDQHRLAEAIAAACPLETIVETAVQNALNACGLGHLYFVRCDET